MNCTRPDYIKNEKLGLPPMQLAETVPQKGYCSKLLEACVTPGLRNLIGTLILAAIAILTYLMIFCSLQDNEAGQTKLIIIGAQDSPNITALNGQLEILVKYDNRTSLPYKIKRKKRSLLSKRNRTLSSGLEPTLADKDIPAARKAIANHNKPCRNENKDEFCKELVTKLKSISKRQDISEPSRSKPLNVQADKSEERSLQSREKLTNQMSVSRNEYRHPHAQPSYPAHQSYPAYPFVLPTAPILPQLDNTCLLARLLKHNMPHLHAVYDEPSPYLAPHYAPLANQPAPVNYASFDQAVPFPYHHSRDAIEIAEDHRPHPQDIEISMRRHTTERPSTVHHHTVRDSSCPSDTLSCDDGETCLLQKQWCDGTVDCADASDEASCSCVSRVDKYRLCDGYFDCPFGEDEMGCYGCAANAFSCEDLDLNSHSTCFTKEQRCNNVIDCPNHKDEADCNLLSSSLHQQPAFAVSNTEGFLMRNFRGDWYPVCSNPYMWAHDACRRETGLIIRPPFIQMLHIDPLLKVTYLNTNTAGVIQTSDSCANSSAVYVTCPDLLCGTRVFTTPQLLRENAAFENRLFGRNKRFLLQDLGYPVVYFGSRRKRHFDNVTDHILNNKALTKRDFIEPYDPDNEEFDKIFERNLGDFRDKKTKEETRNKREVYQTNDSQYRSPFNVKGQKGQKFGSDTFDWRSKRAESRVVGGKPSQPAAWPWMVAMYRDGKFHCGGVVLNRRWVISAAHCVQKFWDHYYEIQIGMLRRFSFSPQEHSLRVTHTIVNQNYDKVDMKNDMSLLRVDPEIQFSRWVRPLCLPGPETAGPEWLWGPQAGTICVAVGWGSTEEHGPDPDHIREVEVPVWSQCKHKEDKDGKEICAGYVEGGKDACQGDSGGPLLCRNPLNSAQWYMAGIVSHGDGCGRKDEPGVYTRVSLYVKWIKHHVFSRTLPVIQPKQECPGFKCLSGISKCLPKDKRCDKIVDCLNGEDEINCNFARNSESLVVDLLMTGEHARNTEKPYLQTKEAKDDDMSKGASSLDLQNASTIEMQNEDDIERKSTTLSVDSEEFTARAVESHETNLDRGDVIPLGKDFNFASAHIEATARETDVTEDWSDFMSTTQHTLTVSKVTNTEFEPEPTTTSTTDRTETIVFTNKHAKTELSEITTPSVETLATSQPLKDQVIDTTTEFIDSKNITLTKNTTSKEPLEINIPLNMDSNLNFGHHNTSANKDIGKHSDLTQKNNKDNKTIEDVKVKPTKHINRNFTAVKAKIHPAHNKRHRRIPEHFQCTRINQVVPFKLRCNHVADCEDGSDEVGCTCVDYVTTFDQTLICDGTVDCSDGQDELNCFECAENHILCKKSKICLHESHVCDGRIDCPEGEDEFNCYALTNGRNLELDFDGAPAINLEGFLTKKHDHNWNVICEDNLTPEEQEAAASHVCRYLGFSSANRLLVKYINVKENENLKARNVDSRKRRDKTVIPTQFARQIFDGDTLKQEILEKPQIIKEECVPNVTRTCMALYVFCEHTLFDRFMHIDIEENELARAERTLWPWIAKIYVEGNYKCTGILIDLSWVLVSHSCLWDSLTPKDHTTVILGTQKVLRSSHGPYEQIYQVDAKKDWLNSKVTLLHLYQPAHYSSKVKPMALSSFLHDGEKNAICVAIGEDNHNNTVSLFLEESHEDCQYPSRCFKRHHNLTLCQPGATSGRNWAGVISCHGSEGWHPSASFVEASGECGIGGEIVATDIGNLRSDIKHYLGKTQTTKVQTDDHCEGVRCTRGRCVKFEQMCDRVRDCEDGVDEGEAACKRKHEMCAEDPYYGGCECASGQLKCRNGRCVSKEQFGNGQDDCGDGSDEPGKVSCAQYLARTMPGRLCDGILHCQDKSDEDPMFCKCFAKNSVKCGSSDHCVSPDVVCDGTADCPHGEDEQVCLALSLPNSTASPGAGMVISNSHGIWHTKCYPYQNHTRTELEQICRKVGFISGHAKQLATPSSYVSPRIKIHLETFQEVALNNNTKIKLRSSNNPLARAIFDNSDEECHPVYIECI